MAGVSSGHASWPHPGGGGCPARAGTAGDVGTALSAGPPQGSSSSPAHQGDPSLPEELGCASQMVLRWDSCLPECREQGGGGAVKYLSAINNNSLTVNRSSLINKRCLINIGCDLFFLLAQLSVRKTLTTTRRCKMKIRSALLGRASP